MVFLAGKMVVYKVGKSLYDLAMEGFKSRIIAESDNHPIPTFSLKTLGNKRLGCPFSWPRAIIVNLLKYYLDKKMK
jgi:hypothetical protein